MPTNTQKNFKKQMKQLQNHIDNNDNEFYSYIKKDTISNYYQKQKRRKTIIRTFSLTSLIILLWNSYAIFTWLRPLFIKFSINQSNISTIVPPSSPPVSTIIESKSSKHEIYSYLQDFNHVDISLQEYQIYFNKNFNIALEDKSSNISTEFKQKLITYLDDISILSLDLKVKSSPVELNIYKELLTTRCNILYNLFSNTIYLLDSYDNVSYNFYVEEHNKINSILDNNSKNLIDELIKVLDDSGIEYEITDTKIEYWIK